VSDARPAPLTIALLGCGAAARMHSRFLSRVAPEVTRVFASRDALRAATFARELGGRAAAGGYEEALHAPEIDAVCVLTPPHLHLDLVRSALRAGKHAIVEKPAFPRSADCDIVAADAKHAARHVYVAENYFYKPLAERLRQIVSEGLVGEPRFLLLNAMKEQRTSGWRDDPTATGGGALFEGGIHWISLLAHLGLAVRRVRAARPGPPAGLDRSMLVMFEFERGAVASLAFSWETRSVLRGLRLSMLFGTAGSALFESNGLFLALAGRKRRFWLTGRSDFLGYHAMWRDFLASIRSGKPARYDLSMAREDLTHVEAAYASAASDAR
jgi:UDP-N-acetylglucosamine 3-dehydrogenase